MSWEVALIAGLGIVSFLLIYLSTTFKQEGTLINGMKILLISAALFLMLHLTSILTTIVDSEPLTSIPAAQAAIFNENLGTAYSVMIYVVIIPFVLFIIIYLLWLLIGSLNKTIKESAGGKRI